VFVQDFDPHTSLVQAVVVHILQAAILIGVSAHENTTISGVSHHIHQSVHATYQTLGQVTVVVYHDHVN
jgi:hypothetical protein